MRTSVTVYYWSARGVMAGRTQVGSTKKVAHIMPRIFIIIFIRKRRRSEEETEEQTDLDCRRLIIDMRKVLLSWSY